MIMMLGGSKMGELHYMISEAAKCVGVESHVLRYWEEELELPIERTEMGHRYYTKENIDLFQCISRLKDEGVTLKELKALCPEILKTKRQLKAKRTGEQYTGKEDSKNESVEKTLQKVLLNNNSILKEEICKIVTQSMKSEISYLLDAKDKLEEDRYKKLDTLIRQQQNHRKEVASKRNSNKIRNLFGGSYGKELEEAGAIY